MASVVNAEQNYGQGEKGDLHTLLWHKCAGSNVYVPSPRDKVFYFPQGHTEQVNAYVDKDSNMTMPIYNLPPKILCHVVNVLLKAETHGDEVYAQITLLPVTEQDQLSFEDENAPSVSQRTGTCAFTKILTKSDCSTHGGLSVPKRNAEECFPPLIFSEEMVQSPPTQFLFAKDMHECDWNFRHIFRGQPKRHLITSNWSQFVTDKKLLPGDRIIFVRGHSGELRVGIRRANKSQDHATASLISGHSMQHGILSCAFHAISTGTMFTVYYRPWTSPAPFIIPFDQYMKSAKNDYSVGMRFRMLFEDEEYAEKRSDGTIVDIEDMDRIRWPGSEWRCLKVKWDSTTDTLLHSDRLSPWSIQPAEFTNKKKTSATILPSKRSHIPDLPSSGFSMLARNGLFPSRMPPRQEKVFQGQESEKHANQLGSPMHDLIHQGPHSSISFSSENMATPSHSNQWPLLLSSFGVVNSAPFSRSMSVPNINSSDSQEIRTFQPRNETQEPFVPPNTLRIFGVALDNSHSDLPSLQVANSTGYVCPSSSTPPISQSCVSESIQVSETSKSAFSVHSEKRSKKCCSVSNRSCIKVLKDGSLPGRSVDLSRFDGYGELISELDQMFDFNGSLIDGSSGWHVIYMDNEKDMMLIGDYLWQEFLSMVRKVFICLKDQEINELNPGSSNVTSH